MSTFDQKLAAQTSQDAVFATNAALALSRQVAARQRQLAQELRTPAVVETAAERAEKEEQRSQAERGGLPGERNEEAEGGADAGTTDGHRFDVRV